MNERPKMVSDEIGIPAYPPEVTRERCIMAAGDGLGRAQMAMQQWSERAKSASEKRTVEILAKRVKEIIGTVDDFTRGL
jgi:hypothetical protein